MGRKGTNLLLDICYEAWKEEIISNEWKIVMIMPIDKKGDNRECNNYREITLPRESY